MVDPVADSRDNPADVLVIQHSEHGVCARIKAHHVEILRKHGGGVRIVRDVKNDGRLTRQHLKSRQQLHCQKALTHRLL